MTIQARFDSNDLRGKLRDGAYELPDDATVTTLMETAQREAGVEITEEQKSNFIFVFDNAPAQYETKLIDGGKLRVMFKLFGG